MIGFQRELDPLTLNKSLLPSRCLFPAKARQRSARKKRKMQTKARALFQRALSSFSFFFPRAKQCMTMHGNNRSLYGKRQNRVEAVVRSGRGDETKRDERDDLHCGVVSHSAMKRHRRGVLRAAASCRTITPRTPQPRRPSKRIRRALSKL